MTVAELIIELKKYDQSIDVAIEGKRGPVIVKTLQPLMKMMNHLL